MLHIRNSWLLDTKRLRAISLSQIQSLSNRPNPAEASLCLAGNNRQCSNMESKCSLALKRSSGFISNYLYVIIYQVWTTIYDMWCESPVASPLGPSASNAKACLCCIRGCVAVGRRGKLNFTLKLNPAPGSSGQGAGGEGISMGGWGERAVASGHAPHPH